MRQGQIRFGASTVNSKACLHLYLVTLLRSYLVSKASTVVCVFCILDDLCCQEEVNKGGGVAVHAPAGDRVHEVGPKQSSFKVIHIPVVVMQSCKLTCTQGLMYKLHMLVMLHGTFHLGTCNQGVYMILMARRTQQHRYMPCRLGQEEQAEAEAV